MPIWSDNYSQYVPSGPHIPEETRERFLKTLIEHSPPISKAELDDAGENRSRSLGKGTLPQSSHLRCSLSLALFIAQIIVDNRIGTDVNNHSREIDCSPT